MEHLHSAVVKNLEMAESGWGRKSVFIKKNLVRSKEKVLQRLGKADETRDEIFECYTQNFAQQQAAVQRLNKEMKNYVTCCKAMSNASRSLYETLQSVYESDWEGEENLNTYKEMLDLLWEDYQRKLTDQVVQPLAKYQGKFPETKKKIEKRGRKLIDYDSARHALDAAKKKDEAKVAKAQETYNDAKRLYEELNSDLHDELPALYDSRIPFYASTFQSLYQAESTFHDEVGKATQQLSDMMANLLQEAQTGNYDIKRKVPTIIQESGIIPTSPSGESSPSSTRDSITGDHLEISRKMENKDDEDDDVTTDYQVPRSTPAVGTRLSAADNEAPKQNDDDRVQSNGALPPKVLYKVVALFEYKTVEEDELSFSKGEIINVIEYDDPREQDEGWLNGYKESDHKIGVFPANFTKEL